MTGTATQGWAFLIARGREAGYQMLLAPEFVVQSGDSGVLIGAVHGEVPDEVPPKIVSVVAPRTGPLSIAYRTHRATRSDVGLTDRKEALLLDRAGRPLILAFGFVCRGSRIDQVDEEDLKKAWEVALRTYQRFHDNEESFASQTSGPYSLRSTIAPLQEEFEPTSRSPEPGSPSAVAPKRRVGQRSSMRNYGPLFVLLTSIVFVSVALGTVAWLVTRTPEVTVPDVVGLTQTDAQQRLREVKLKPVIQWQTAGCQRGTVTVQLPKKEAVVDEHSDVTLTVCGSP